MSAGQLPPEQLEMEATPQIPKQSEPTIGNFQSDSAPIESIESSADSNKSTVMNETVMRGSNQTVLPSSLLNSPNTESPKTDTPNLEASISRKDQTNPTVSVPDEVVRAARAAPRLVPPFKAEENIPIEEGSNAEDVIDGIPKSGPDVG